MPSSYRYFDGLTGLRALAAAWVVDFHYRSGPFRSIGASHVLPIVGYGYLGIDLFFILTRCMSATQRAPWSASRCAPG